MVSVARTPNSLLFLTHTHVFKFLRPVRHGFVDQRLCSTRSETLRGELKWHSENSPILGCCLISAVPGRLGGYTLVFQEEPQAPEYGLMMRRLPEADNLATMLANPQNDRQRLFRRLCADIGVHLSRRPPAQIDGSLYLAQLRENLDLQHRILQKQCRRANSLVRPVSILYGAAAGTLAHICDILLERCRDGSIRQFHGDLRADHIFFCGTDTVFIDPAVDPRFTNIDGCCELSPLLNDIALLVGPMESEHLCGRLGYAGALRRVTLYFQMLKSLVFIRFNLYAHMPVGELRDRVSTLLQLCDQE